MWCWQRRPFLCSSPVYSREPPLPAQPHKHPGQDTAGVTHSRGCPREAWHTSACEKVNRSTVFKKHYSCMWTFWLHSPLLSFKELKRVSLYAANNDDAFKAIERGATHASAWALRLLFVYTVSVGYWRWQCGYVCVQKEIRLFRRHDPRFQIAQPSTYNPTGEWQ